MNTEQKIAFRQLISDVLMHMMEKGRSPGEILEVQHRLETEVVQLINDNLRGLMPGATGMVYLMGIADLTEFRVLIAGTLNQIAQPGCSAEKVMEMIKGLEGWVEEKIEKTLRHFAGKPKVSVTRHRDLPN